ncbi:hypothetical protein HPB50_008755 [Hyalomma asiaticum]|uniref:Uncharacterized protein n=1 Tax=Hyalomma asiaticum TaxID=266040 RepID=A0ACB7SRH8_HYAAI|nr:hypothetical protein HPB50_008755 [Hyalomma asiaticum]
MPYQTAYHLARRAGSANVTASQPALPFPSTASSQGPCSLPDPPMQPAEEAAASILCSRLLEQTSSSPPTTGNERDRNARPHVEESSSSEEDQEDSHASDLTSSSREHTTPPSPASSSPQASDDNNSSQLTTAAAEPSASASPGPSLTLPKGKQARHSSPSSILETPARTRHTCLRLGLAGAIAVRRRRTLCHLCGLSPENQKNPTTVTQE